MTEMKRKLSIKERSCGVTSPPEIKKADGTRKGANDSIYFICRTIQAQALKPSSFFNSIFKMVSKIVNTITASPKSEGVR
tara:strand:- start:2475 stop:2714 length:240 start_codon:yes stop_codon:yes gene_type:complete